MASDEGLRVEMRMVGRGKNKKLCRVFIIEMPEMPEAPKGYVVTSEGLKTCHRPYR